MKYTCNVALYPRSDESQEKFIRRFFKKCKKVGILEEYLEKTSYYKKPSIKKKEKINKNKFLKEKNE